MKQLNSSELVVTTITNFVDVCVRIVLMSRITEVVHSVSMFL